MQVNFSAKRTIPAKPVKPWPAILLSLIFIIVGIILLFISISFIKTYNEKNKTYIAIKSKIVDYKYNDEGLQAIVVEYAVDGQIYQKISDTYSNMPKNIGTEVLIKYNPANPQDIIWTSDNTNIILLIAGGIFFLMGLIIVIFCIKSVNNQKMMEEQVVKQANGLYSYIDESQIDNASLQNKQSINNNNQQSINNYDIKDE